MQQYIKHELEFNGRPVYGIELLEYPFDGIIIIYNSVKLIEEDDHVRLKFDYDIYKNNTNKYSKKELETVLGLILQELIIEGLETHSLVYSGGTDAKD